MYKCINLVCSGARRGTEIAGKIAGSAQKFRQKRAKLLGNLRVVNHDGFRKMRDSPNKIRP